MGGGWKVGEEGEMARMGGGRVLGENRDWRWLRSGRERVLFLGGIKWAEPDRENRGPDHHHRREREQQANANRRGKREGGVEAEEGGQTRAGKSPDEETSCWPGLEGLDWMGWTGWAALDGTDGMRREGQDGEMSLNAHGMGKPQNHQGTRTIISDTKAKGDGRREK